MAYISGARTTYTNTDDHKENLANGLDYLKPSHDIRYLKKIGTNGFTSPGKKFEWTEVELATRSEPITLATTATNPTVVDAYQYAVGDLIKIRDEILRVTAIADATTLTVTRGYGDTSDPGTTHSAQTAINLGGADAENAAAGDSRTDAPVKLYNFFQTSQAVVEMSADEIAQSSTEGNPLTGNLKRRFVEENRKLAARLFYGRRDDTGTTRTSGGIDYFLSTNVTAVGGALSVAVIDAEIKAIVDVGGNPTSLVMNTTQKQKLDALDASLVRIGKATRVGGNPITQTWQSGILDHTIDIVLDANVKQDEMFIMDDSLVKAGHLSGNGVNGAWHTEDATVKGTDGVKKVLRGKYGFKIMQEKAHAKLETLTT